MKKSPRQKKQIKKAKQYASINRFVYIKRVALLILAIGILSFNAVIKIDVKAENKTEAITVENLLRAHNEYRKEQGLPELHLNNLLNISSQNKGQVMLDNNCWSHYCPPGKSPWDFFDNAQYNYVYAGENLAEGYYTIDTVMQAWINSKTHRDNIVKPEFTEIGFSILYGNYLNNSNNVLVVTHFGATSEGVAVKSAQNPILEITSPKNNFVSPTESLDISGTVSGLDKVNVYNNNQLKGAADISGGIFTYRIERLDQGNNSIWVDGTRDSTELNSSQVNVVFNSVQEQSTTFELVSDSNSGLTMSVEDKNTINLIFIAALAILFIIDIILVSRTSAITSAKSFSHYHLGLFILLAVIILVGGFAGQIQNGITI